MRMKWECPPPPNNENEVVMQGEEGNIRTVDQGTGPHRHGDWGSPQPFRALSLGPLCFLSRGRGSLKLAETKKGQNFVLMFKTYIPLPLG